MLPPVLTYHSAYISGNDYSSNDHVAFASDLRLVHKLGLRIAPLDLVVDRMLRGEGAPSGSVAFTMDDGTNFDYYDLPHPSWGMQRSMLNIMRDFVDEMGDQAQPDLHATSFVIASPAARRELDRTCLIGCDWYTDEWWTPAIASGLMGIGNHSWDHNHTGVAVVSQRTQDKGTFINIDTFGDADAQIRQASNFLAAKTSGLASRLFAYPYGETNDYLALSYLPAFVAQHGLKAAFVAGSHQVEGADARWCIPRLVYRDHWHTSDQLAEILAAATRP